jgi:hypothetical protein
MESHEDNHVVVIKTAIFPLPQQRISSIMYTSMKIPSAASLIKTLERANSSPVVICLIKKSKLPTGRREQQYSSSRHTSSTPKQPIPMTLSPTALPHPNNGDHSEDFIVQEDEQIDATPSICDHLSTKDGKLPKQVAAQFGHSRTKAEEIITAPCGIIKAWKMQYFAVSILNVAVWLLTLLNQMC